MNDDFWNDYFHTCAIIAYMEITDETKQIPPDSDLVRQRAYAIYEKVKRNECANQAQYYLETKIK